MAITQVGSATTAGDASGGSITITKPTGVASGDVLVAVLTHNNQTPNLPSGWAIQATQQATATGNSFWCSVAYKVAGGSEGASYNFTYSDTSAGAPFFGSITAWRGVNTSSPFGGLNSSSSGNAGEPHSSGTISNNTVVAGRAFYTRHCRSSGAPAATISQSSASGGISELVDSGQSSGAGGTRYQHALWVGTADFSTVGPPAAISSTASATETDSIWITFTLEVQPVSASATKADATATAYTAGTAVGTDATKADATATAYNASVLTGVAAENTGYAAATATAYNAAGWVIHPVDVGAVAFNATVAITTEATHAAASVAVGSSVGYFGAPESRRWRIPPEDRSWAIQPETRSWNIPPED